SAASAFHSGSLFGASMPAMWPRGGDESRLAAQRNTRAEGDGVAAPRSERVGLAGVELEHVQRRAAAGIRRAAVAERTRRYAARHRHQLARSIEVEDVERDLGVLHPVRQRALGVVHEDHAGAFGERFAEHQATIALGIVVRHLHLEALAVE